MNILCLLFIICGFSFAQAFSQQPLLGVWKLQRTLCHNPVTQQSVETPLLKLPLVGTLPDGYNFQPQVELTVSESQNSQVHIQKKVKENSCPGRIGDRALLRSVYEAKVLSMRWNGYPYFQVTSSEAPRLDKIEYEINSDLLNECGPKALSLALRALVYFKFPRYFLHEAGRGYQMYLDLSSQQLFVRFAEPEICDGTTVMVFKK